MYNFFPHEVQQIRNFSIHSVPWVSGRQFLPPGIIRYTCHLSLHLVAFSPCPSKFCSLNKARGCPHKHPSHEISGDTGHNLAKQILPVAVSKGHPAECPCLLFSSAAERRGELHPQPPPQASKSHFPYQTSKPWEMQGRFLLIHSFISMWISWNKKWALGLIHSSGCSVLDGNFQKSDPPSCPCHQRPLPPQLGEPVTKKATDFASWNFQKVGVSNLRRSFLFSPLLLLLLLPLFLDTSAC